MPDINHKVELQTRSCGSESAVRELLRLPQYRLLGSAPPALGRVASGRGADLVRRTQNFGSYLGRTLRIGCLRLRMAAVSRCREKQETAAQRAAVLVGRVPPVGFEPTPPPPEGGALSPELRGRQRVELYQFRGTGRARVSRGVPWGLWPPLLHPSPTTPLSCALPPGLGGGRGCLWWMTVRSFGS